MGKRIIQQARGKGGPTYRAPSFKYQGQAKVRNIESSVRVLDIVKCRGHSAPLIAMEYDDGEFGFNIASEGIRSGDVLSVGAGSELKLGNILPLLEVPEGSFVFNIEGIPGDGGKFIRASGSFAKVVSRTSDKVVVLMPSKKRKEFHPNCRATIGIVAGAGRVDKPFLKAGTKHYAMKAKNKLWPNVSGSAMNAVDHPMGNKRTARKSKGRPVPRNAPPGRKVGMLRPRHTGRNK